MVHELKQVYVKWKKLTHYSVSLPFRPHYVYQAYIKVQLSKSKYIVRFSISKRLNNSIPAVMLKKKKIQKYWWTHDF